MAAITNQIKQSITEEPQPEIKEKKHSSKKNWLYESLDLSRYVDSKTIIRNLPFIFFLSAFGLLYIWNAHYSEKNVMDPNQGEKQLNELRWYCMTTQSELEHLSTEAEVAKMVAPADLEDLQEPPKKILTPQHGN